MTPMDSQATSLVGEMAVTDKINILSGDHTTNPTPRPAWLSVPLASPA